MIYVANSLVDTENFGKVLGEMLEGGMIVCLTGHLGAGKTTLSKTLIASLGVTDDVTSPTYTIVNEYDNDPRVFHFDVYRICDIDEFYEIGYEDYFNQNAVCIIEWANIVEEVIPEDAIWIDIKYCQGDGCRELTVTGNQKLIDSFERKL
jgi:tRNA threonylcarbamoyladenosine biosynthesis protein TsaE